MKELERLNQLLAYEDIHRCIVLVDARDKYLLDDFHFEKAMRLLSLNLQHKVLMKKGQTRNTALCNQLLQLITCSKASRQPWQSIKFSFSNNGKPSLNSSTPISFSMSNCDGRTAIYLRKDESLTDVGVDLASTKDCRRWENDYLQLFQDIFSKDEYEHISSFPSGKTRDGLFTHYWSLKEAYTKYTGTGLNCNLADVDFGKIRPVEADEVFKITRNIDDKAFSFVSKWLDHEIVITVCDGPAIESEELLNIPIIWLDVRTIVDNLDSMK